MFFQSNIWHYPAYSKVADITLRAVNSYSSDRDVTGSTGVIGHYTQIVWATTAEVGCGYMTSSVNGRLESVRKLIYLRNQLLEYNSCVYINFVNKISNLVYIWFLKRYWYVTTDLVEIGEELPFINKEMQDLIVQKGHPKHQLDYVLRNGILILLIEKTFIEIFIYLLSV